MAGTALALWFMTILGGSYMMFMAMGSGGGRGSVGHSHWPSWLVFTHGAIAVSGAALWFAFMTYREEWMAWTSFATLLVVATLGEVLFTTWFKDRRAVARAERGGEVAQVSDKVPRNVPPTSSRERVQQVEVEEDVPVTELAERRIPVVAVWAHGLLAVATIVMVLIASIQA